MGPLGRQTGGLRNLLVNPRGQGKVKATLQQSLAYFLFSSHLSLLSPDPVLGHSPDSQSWLLSRLYACPVLQLSKSTLSHRGHDRGPKVPRPQASLPTPLTWLGSALPLGSRCGSWDLGGASLEQDLGLVRSLSIYVWPTLTSQGDEWGNTAGLWKTKEGHPQVSRSNLGLWTREPQPSKSHGVHWAPAQELRMTQVPVKAWGQGYAGSPCPSGPRTTGSQRC